MRAIERQTSAGGVGAEFSLRHVRRQADWGNGFDQLAGFHGVAIGATNVQDGDAGEGRVGVEGDLARAERTGGGATADGQLRGLHATTHVDPDIAQGVGADVVRSAEDNRGRVAAAADDEAVGRVGRSDRAIEVSGCTPSHNLGVTIEGHRAGEDFTAVEAEGTDAALSGRRVAGEVQAQRRRAAVGLRITEAPTGDSEVIGVGAALHPDLGTVLDDHVGRTEGITVRNVDAFGVWRRDARRRRLHDVGTGEAAVVTRERHRAAACRTGDVAVDAHRTRAGDVRGHGEVGVGTGDLQRRTRGDVDNRVRGQDGGATEFKRARGEVGAAVVRIGTSQDEVTRTGLVQADEAEAACAIGEGAGIGGFNRVREVRHTHGGGVGVGDGGRIGALGDLDEVLAEAVQVDQGSTVDAQFDFRGRQDGVVLTEAQGAFTHVEQGVARARSRRVQENRALTDRWLSGAGDEVAGQGEVTRGHRARIADASEVVAARGDARVEGDTAGDRGDVRIANQHDDTRAIETTSGDAVEDDVIGYRDASAELEARAAVDVGAWLSSQGDSATGEAERIGNLHVTFSDRQVTGDVVIDQGGQDETAVTGLRQVSGARDSHGWVERTVRADIKGDGARHRDG